MKRARLGHTGPEVPSLCLGTMTFSTQTPVDEALGMIDACLDHGVDFLDTAEMYPVNPNVAKNVGNSERVIGEWIARGGDRNRLRIATKVSGAGLKIVRDGAPISPKTIREAAEASLIRLNVDYINLYQMHWPNRGSYHFRQIWRYDPSAQSTADVLADIDDCLGEFGRLVEEGKIGSIGLSNESAWGVRRFTEAADRSGLPRVVSIQNEYSLLCRIADGDLEECLHHEDVPMLAFSPLAAGLLTGKYQDGGKPEGSRRTFGETLGGRYTERAVAATAAYLDLAAEAGLDPVHMALAFCVSRHFMGSTIFGATTRAQLDHILAGKDVSLSADVLEKIDDIHRAHPAPY